MLVEVGGFIHLLRRAGLVISQGEVIDAFAAILQVGLGRDEVKWALMSTLVKEEGDIQIFERIYTRYFQRSSPSDVLPRKINVDAVLAAPPRLNPETFKERLEEIKNSLKKERTGSAQRSNFGLPFGRGKGGVSTAEAGSASQLRDVVHHGNDEELRALARAAVDGIRSRWKNGREESFEEILRQVKVSLRWAETLALDRAEGFPDMSRWEIMEEHLRRELEDAWLGETEEAVEKIARRANFREVEFNRLSPKQVMTVKRLLVRLGRSLATRYGYRWEPSRRGSVDIRNTIRLAASRGGVPLYLKRQERRLQKPELIVLCDLSGSVAPFSEFMLLFLWAVQERFARVRSFAFVNTVEEITGLLKGINFEDAFLRIMRETNIPVNGFSDYGAVWSDFYRRYLETMTPRTTLVILGDARNNYKDPGKDYFHHICAKARQVVWLNPAPRSDWDREDSIMSVYAPYCAHVYECRNLDQLERVVRALFRDKSFGARGANHISSSFLKD